ncbi:50S ribosomal protein L29 [Candidatus Magnetaquicoccaceae bacterium FCR-1]|uniref:Large ribosomal subunit protein uL29 n=1 Tax=Candidatus Magnetaquiglobus chichijimensis TaxID=3141448 RepID=A0ABQ0CBC0_9PROT
MKAAEVRSLTEEQIADKLRELHQEAFNLRFQLATAQLENTARIRKVRKEISRIMTIQGERARQQNAVAKGS